MKHIFRILFCASLIFNFQLSTFNLLAQPFPQGYFRNPMDHDIGLSATFGEFRTGHFHAGLDMRTGGETGKPVYAAADGYVAKVSISPWGGGKILYIKHPNGYTTVYMHLNDYVGAIGKAVLKEQYAQRSYSISKLFAPNELPVKKGQMVAHSGNTGGSGGPHLHFEVRRGGIEDLHTHSTTINPLLFDLPYKDNIKPTLRGLRIYPVGGNPIDIGKESAVTVPTEFYLGIYATDDAEGSTAKNGIDRVEVYLDGTLFFLYTTESIPVDSSRMVNALIDFRHYANTRQAYLLTRTLPGAEGPWIPVHQGDGIFRLKAGSTHHIGVKVYDIMDNCAEQVVTVKVQAESGKRKSESVGEAAKYDQPFSFSDPNFTVQFPPFTLYADDRMKVQTDDAAPVTTPIVTIQPTLNDIPPHLAYTLSLKPKAPLAAETDKVVVVRIDGNKTSAYSTTYADGWYTTQVRDFGQFTLAIDTVTPNVRPINFSEGKPFKGSLLKVKIGDNLAGVETYKCYLNGEWILGEYDGKTATVFIDAAGKLRSGKNELRVEVTDGSGNLTRRSFTITR